MFLLFASCQTRTHAHLKFIVLNSENFHNNNKRNITTTKRNTTRIRPNIVVIHHYLFIINNTFRTEAVPIPYSSYNNKILISTGSFNISAQKTKNSITT